MQSHFRQIRSYVKRDSRTTKAQNAAKELLGPKFILANDQLITDFSAIFERDAPLYVEIGFGTGQSLLQAAKLHPDKNFIGIETHKPGIGAVLIGIEREEMTNVRLFYGDSVPIFKNVFTDASLDGVQIFFPDPWQKRRHHERRLIQRNFLSLIANKLKTHGTLHLATDWEDYALHMLKVISDEKIFTNARGVNQFSERSQYRPILSKFETRAVKEGRVIRDIHLQKIS